MVRLPLTTMAYTHLHAPVGQVSVDERDPGSRCEGVESLSIEIGIVLVPGNSGLLVVWGLHTQVPHWMTWRGIADALILSNLM